MAHPRTILAVLVLTCFSLGTWLDGSAQSATQRHTASANLFELLLGDGRRLFANHFFVKADVYFHGGYYPSIFDAAAPPARTHISSIATAPPDEDHAREAEGGEAHGKGAQPDEAKPAASHEAGHAEHEEEMDFLGPPKDILDRFGRHFFASEHSHLRRAEDTRELLPWLRLSADLDPHRVQTYTVTAFWLTTQMRKIDEALQFLREGWRNNPNSYAILLEMGRIHDVHRNDHFRARNLLELALKKWQATEPQKPQPDLFAYEKILARLADLEERDGRMAECIFYLEKLKTVSPSPETIEKQIAERRKRLGGSPKP